MALKPPTQYEVDDPKAQRAIDSINRVLGQAIGKEVLDGVLVVGIVITAGVEAQAPHGLGRRPVGRMIVRQSADGRVWDTQDANTNADRTWALNASADMTVSAWFF